MTGERKKTISGRTLPAIHWLFFFFFFFVKGESKQRLPENVTMNNNDLF